MPKRTTARPVPLTERVLTMCQYGTCPNTATTMVTSYESGDDLAVCAEHVHVGANPGTISLSY